MQTDSHTLLLDGKTITATLSDLAEQADGSVMLSCEGTVVFATAVMGNDATNNPGYFNLQVEFQERHYAVGEIAGSQFMRQEGRPSTGAVLSSRMIDRTIRPLFPHSMKNSVQVIITVIAVGTYSPTILAINAVSLALGLSRIPWSGPVGAVQYSNAAIGDEILMNTHHRDTKEDPAFTLVVCGKDNTINMVEAGVPEIPENILGGMFDTALVHITALEAWQKKIIASAGKQKDLHEEPVVPAELVTLFETTMASSLSDIFSKESKKVLHEKHDAWKKIVAEAFPDKTDEHAHVRSFSGDYFHHQVDALVHTEALDKKRRADLRAMDEVRDVFAQAGSVSERLHGSGIFYRGGTHVLSVLTLGGPDDRLVVHGMEVVGDRYFFHHYNFPPFSAGETGRIGGMNRRAIGHGMLAERALRPVLPAQDQFPYTIRIVSESMASNGSTSQGSICAGSLALMDAGVPITRHVAGVAMGLMADSKDHSRYAILTDIQGPEDHHGDMDFKVAGTTQGITAIQLDVKVDGISSKILCEALDKARTARIGIIEVMQKTIDKPRPSLSPFAPKILSIKIEPEDIGSVIGGGGKRIQELQKRTQTTITIKDDGMVYVFGIGDGPEEARLAIEGVTKKWAPGDRVVGKVVKILDEIGAIVALSEFAEGLVHISEIALFRINKVSEVLHEGDEVPVTVLKVDKEKGRISLSIKTDNPEFIK